MQKQHEIYLPEQELHIPKRRTQREIQEEWNKRLKARGQEAWASRRVTGRGLISRREAHRKRYGKSKEGN